MGNILQGGRVMLRGFALLTVLLAAPLAASLAALMFMAATAHGEPWKYGYTPPPGWAQAEANGVTVFTSPDQGALMLLNPPIPLGPDFEAQAAAARASIEAGMGLRDGQQASPQRGSAQGGKYVMYSGSYTSDAGPRYLMLYAVAQQGAFGLTVFVATSHPAFQQRAPEAATLFNALRIQSGSGPVVAPPPVSPPAQSAARPAAHSGGGLANVGRAIAIPPNSTNALTTGATLSDLMGVWVADTIVRNDRISMGYFNDSWGNTHWGSSYTMGTPMGAGGTYLKVRPDGSYEYWFNHVERGCDRAHGHAGSISVQNGVAVLSAARAHERGGPVKAGVGCPQYDRETTPARKSYRIEIGSYTTPFGYPTYRLRLNNVDGSSDYMVLDRVEARPLPDNAIPPNFKTGGGQAAGDLQGLWAAVGELNFGNSLTQPNPKKYFGVLRILPGGRYELAVNNPDVLYAPVCTKSLTLQEAGTAQFQGEMDRYDNRHESGTVVLTPDQSRLTVEVERCGPETTPKQIIELPSAPRYLKWDLKMQNPATGAPLAGDKLQIVCPNAYEPSAAWRYLFCPETAGQVYDGYTRR